MFRIKKPLFKTSSGFTLVEVIVAMFIIVLVSVGLIQGTMVALNTVKANKGKTIAVSIANEKLEILRGMDYEDIGLTDENPGWEISYPELSEEGYSIYYYSSWVDDEEESYKQVMVSVNNPEMRVPVEVVTRIYPSPGNTPEEEPDYPSPSNLSVAYDTGYGAQREIELIWDVPDTEREIERYNVYRDGELAGSALAEMYLDYPGDDNEHTYYVTAVYYDGTESLPSSSVTTESELAYPAPQNLNIAGYSSGGPNKIVNLVWQAPDSPVTIVEYRIYRNGQYIGSTTSTNYSNKIGKNNYTFHVTALYEGGIESEPSNSVTTE